MDMTVTVYTVPVPTRGPKQCNTDYRRPKVVDDETTYEEIFIPGKGRRS
jgi:hypothetical protein